VLSANNVTAQASALAQPAISAGRATPRLVVCAGPSTTKPGVRKPGGKPAGTAEAKGHATASGVASSGRGWSGRLAPAFLVRHENDSLCSNQGDYREVLMGFNKPLLEVVTNSCYSKTMSEGAEGKSAQMTCANGDPQLSGVLAKPWKSGRKFSHSAWHAGVGSR
jgi:hypothetical protein